MELLLIPIVMLGLIWALAIQSGGWLHNVDKEMRKIMKDMREGRR